MPPDLLPILEPRASLRAALDFLQECPSMEGNTRAGGNPLARVGTSPKFQATWAEFSRLLSDAGRPEWETLMVGAAEAAGVRRIPTLVVARRFSPVLATLAMFTQPDRIEWEQILHARLDLEDFKRLTTQAARLMKAPWACLDARMSRPGTPLFGPSFAALARERQVGMVVLDQPPAPADRRRLTACARRLGFTVLYPENPMPGEDSRRRSQGC